MVAPMRITESLCGIVIVAIAVLSTPAATAQSAANLMALQGLAPVSTLQNSDAGRAALAADVTITASIQDGTAQQPSLLPFPEQRQQALRDALITGGNAYELAEAWAAEQAKATRGIDQWERQIEQPRRR
jgi:hypothetical protein